MKVPILMLMVTSLTSALLTEDFISGFEAGVYVRNDDRAYGEYNCPKPEANDALARQVQGLITPMKLMGNMMAGGGSGDKHIKEITDAIAVFIEGVIELMSLFRGDYDQGDFCSGLVFGRDGSKMLLQLASAFVKHSDKESNRPDFKPRVPSHSNAESLTVD